jgi:hypothetical protein
MATADYHRRQADVLTRLAHSTRDPETAASLMRLAAEHTMLADEAERAVQQQPTRPKKDD